MLIRLCEIIIFSLLFHFVLTGQCGKTEYQYDSVLVVIRSQPNEYHNNVANVSKRSLEAQADNYDLDVKVIIMHQEWPVESAWAILPIMPSIAQKFGDDYEWIMFIEENTNIDLLHFLKAVASKYNSEEDVYVGRCLVDQKITIIHHFAFHDGGLDKFNYPDFHAGWFLSKRLVQRLAENWESGKSSSDFQIDLQHEVAMHIDKKVGVKMTCSDDFCGVLDKDKCVTWVDHEIPDCGQKISLDDVLISVKTTKKFHNTRVQVVKDTWGKFAKNIIYYSNVTDTTIPTVDCGVPNTVTGHCGKMEVIINDAHDKDDLKEFPWLVIADDDSIIGLAQLVKLLNCYKPKLPVVLGERYGFGLNTGHGYSYITGGGSMVMSRGAVNAWVEKGCKCPSISTPDDMMLGQCFSGVVGVPVIHSPRFHQARPEDYSKGYISNFQPISFHKHTDVDPIKVYEAYFADDDKAMSTNITDPSSAVKDEL